MDYTWKIAKTIDRTLCVCGIVNASQHFVEFMSKHKMAMKIAVQKISNLELNSKTLHYLFAHEVILMAL